MLTKFNRKAIKLPTNFGAGSDGPFPEINPSVNHVKNQMFSLTRNHLNKQQWDPLPHGPRRRCPSTCEPSYMMHESEPPVPNQRAWKCNLNSVAISFWLYNCTWKKLSDPMPRQINSSQALLFSTNRAPGLMVQPEVSWYNCLLLLIQKKKKQRGKGQRSNRAALLIRVICRALARNDLHVPWNGKLKELHILWSNRPHKFSFLELLKPRSWK